MEAHYNKQVGKEKIKQRAKNKLKTVSNMKASKEMSDGIHEENIDVDSHDAPGQVDDKNIDGELSLP